MNFTFFRFCCLWVTLCGLNLTFVEMFQFVGYVYVISEVWYIINLPAAFCGIYILCYILTTRVGFRLKETYFCCASGRKGFLLDERDFFGEKGISSGRKGFFWKFLEESSFFCGRYQKETKHKLYVMKTLNQCCLISKRSEAVVRCKSTRRKWQSDMIASPLLTHPSNMPFYY